MAVASDFHRNFLIPERRPICLFRQCLAAMNCAILLRVYIIPYSYTFVNFYIGFFITKTVHLQILQDIEVKIAKCAARLIDKHKK